MRKNILGVFALTVIAGAVHAQSQTSSVQLYGRLDASVGHIGGPASTTRLNDGVGATSHIGFRGSEALGGGTSAIFNLEMKVQPNNGIAGAGIASGANLNPGVTGIFSRNSYVGLQGGFGTVTLGRNIPAGIRALSNFNAIASGINTGTAGNVAPMGIGNDFWNNNMVKYDTPDFNGFSGSANYAFGGAVNNSELGRSWGATVFWRGSGLSLAASKQYDTSPTSTARLDWSVLSAAYTTGPFKVTTGYTRVHNPTRIAGWIDSKLWTVGGSYAIAPAITVAAQYFNVKDTTTGTSSKQVVLNGVYALSKRTNFYVMLTRTDNGAIPTMPLYGYAGTPFTKTNNYALGLQHYF